MNRNSSQMNFYCSNIGNKERDEEPAGAGFFILALYLWRYRAVLELLLWVVDSWVKRLLSSSFLVDNPM